VNTPDLDGENMTRRERWAVGNADDIERLLPGFEPMRLGRVESIYLDFDKDGTLTVRLRAEYWTPTPPELIVEITFFGARQVSLPVLGLLDISELEIIDISDRQLEGIQREVINHGSERFSLFCKEAKITDVVERSE